jgi:hypothetical protein
LAFDGKSNLFVADFYGTGADSSWTFRVRTGTSGDLQIHGQRNADYLSPMDLEFGFSRQEMGMQESAGRGAIKDS